MAQYKTGTVAVTNGSAVITGSGTLWLTEASAGDLFTIEGEGVIYEIGAVNSNTQITLAANYAGATGSGKSYAVARDFTPFSGYPYPTKGDIETAAIMKRALLMLDGETPGTASVAFDKEHNGQGGHTDITTGDITMAPAAGLTLGGTRRTTFPALNFEQQHNTEGEHTAVTAQSITLGGAQRTTWPDPGSGSQSLQDVLDNGYVATTTPYLPDVALTTQAINPAWAVSIACCIASNDKDTDGGKWKQRCSHTSWYNESRPSGQYLGIYANESAARAAGGTTGDWYARTATPAFYSLNASSGETQIYRAGSQDYPAEVAVVAWAGQVVLFDLTQPGCPMWMIFVTGSGYMLGSGAQTITCLAVKNGTLAVGKSNAAFAIDFAADRGNDWDTTARWLFNGGISDRNSAKGFTRQNFLGIVNGAVNSIAISVVPCAPIDVTTGMPVPTIDVWTEGGFSRIKDDGSVASDTSIYGRAKQKKGAVLGSGRICGIAEGGNPQDSVLWIEDPATIPFTEGTNTRYPFPPSGDAALQLALGGSTHTWGSIVAADNEVVVGTDKGMISIRENPNEPTKGMLSYTTKDYTTGWLPGDIRGAWLADTTAETLVGSELVTNGTFDTDTTGWTAGNSATLSVVSGQLKILVDAGQTYGEATQVIGGLTVGKTYTLAVNFDKQSASKGTVADSGGNLINQDLTVNGRYSWTFVAPASSITLKLIAYTASAYCYFDDVTCRLAVPDRSVKNKGLQVFGSITKAAVAAGASTMAYSGFSSVNYLEQPYNADLDFGTSDFFVMGWVNSTSIGPIQILFSRGDADGTPRFYGALSNVDSNTMAFWLNDNAAGDSYVRSSGLASNADFFFVALRRAGSIELYIDGDLDVAASSNPSVERNVSSVDGTARLRWGVGTDGVYPLLGKFSLCRVGAGAPTAEQIKHIYNTEKHLFNTGAQGVLPGTSDASLDLGYDNITGILHGHTSYGRFGFKDLLRVESEATAVGTPSCVAAHDGVVVQGGSIGAMIYVPALTLREELERGREQREAFGSSLEGFWFTGNGSLTTVALPAGWQPKFVYNAGALLKEGDDYTVEFDGFVYSIVFAAAPTNGNDICVMARRA